MRTLREAGFWVYDLLRQMTDLSPADWYVVACVVILALVLVAYRAV